MPRSPPQPAQTHRTPRSTAVVLARARHRLRRRPHSTVNGFPASGDLRQSRVHVVGKRAMPAPDRVILDAAHDEQLAVREEAQLPGSQPRPFGNTARPGDKPGTERALGLVGPAPIAQRGIAAVHPDLTGRIRRALNSAGGVDNPHDRGSRDTVADQRGTAPDTRRPVREAGGQLRGIGADDLRRTARPAGRHVCRRFSVRTRA
jgi:hypothetical protein